VQIANQHLSRLSLSRERSRDFTLVSSTTVEAQRYVLVSTLRGTPVRSGGCSAKEFPFVTSAQQLYVEFRSFQANLESVAHVHLVELDTSKSRVVEKNSASASEVIMYYEIIIIK
jgi:uncharacterized protein YcfL